MRTKVLEAKYQEEKLKLQQRHDADVQKVFHFSVTVFLHSLLLRSHLCWPQFGHSDNVIGKSSGRVKFVVMIKKHLNYRTCSWSGTTMQSDLPE